MPTCFMKTMIKRGGDGEMGLLLKIPGDIGDIIEALRLPPGEFGGGFALRSLRWHCINVAYFLQAKHVPLLG